MDASEHACRLPSSSFRTETCSKVQRVFRALLKTVIWVSPPVPPGRCALPLRGTASGRRRTAAAGCHLLGYCPVAKAAPACVRSLQAGRFGARLTVAFPRACRARRCRYCFALNTHSKSKRRARAVGLSDRRPSILHQSQERLVPLIKAPFRSAVPLVAFLYASSGESVVDEYVSN